MNSGAVKLPFDSRTSIAQRDAHRILCPYQRQRSTRARGPHKTISPLTFLILPFRNSEQVEYGLATSFK